MSTESPLNDESESVDLVPMQAPHVPNTTVSEQTSMSGFDIPASIRDSLPATVKGEISRLSNVQRDAFIEEFRRKSKSTGVAYFCWLFGLHYAYLGKWGKLALYLFTGGGFLIWIVVDAFRMGSIVSDYNKDVAASVMRDIKIMSH